MKKESKLSQEEKRNRIETRSKEIERIFKDSGIPFRDMTEESEGQTTIFLTCGFGPEEDEPEFEEFDDPDVEFVAVIDFDEVVLQIGYEYWSQFEEMTDLEITEFAKSKGYLEDPEDGYIDVNGKVDVDKLRQDFIVGEEYECAFARANHTYPCGRAYNYFEKLKPEIPSEIGLQLLEWGHLIPLHIAQLPNLESVINLQRFLAENGIRANFDVKTSMEVW